MSIVKSCNYCINKENCIARIEIDNSISHLPNFVDIASLAVSSIFWQSIANNCKKYSQQK